MKKAIPLLICIVLLLALAGCGSQKYGNIVNMLDNKQYDEAISEIRRIRNESQGGDNQEFLEIQDYVNKSAEIRYSTNYSPLHGSQGKGYTLERDHHLKDDYCTYTIYKDREYKSYMFSIEKYNELIDLILKGNPKMFKGSVDSEGRYGTETVDAVIELFHANTAIDSIRITVSNNAEIEEFFTKIDKASR